MYLVIETDANRRNPEAYGRLHRVCGVTDNLTDAVERIASELGVELWDLKTILTTGVTGRAHPLLISGDLEEVERTQLFAEFQSVKRYWVVKGRPL